MMYDTGKLAKVTGEIRRYNLHILGISESRWTGSGRYRTNTGETVVETMTNTTRELRHPEERNGDVPDGMEANQLQADEDQNEGEAHQHHHHPVLCTNQQQ